MVRDLCWILLYTKPRAEAWAEAALRKEGLVTMLPRVRTRSGFAPLFPRYLFAGGSARLLDAPFPPRAGVLYAVPRGDAPARVPPAIVQMVRARMAASDTVELDAAPTPDSLFTTARRERVRSLLRAVGADVAAAV